MVDFRILNNPSFWFYNGKKVLLETNSAFADVSYYNGKTHVGQNLYDNQKVIAFLMPAEPAFVVEGQLFDIFALKATAACEAGRASSRTPQESFSALGTRSIDLISSRFGGQAVASTFTLSDELVDCRERLLLCLNEALAKVFRGLDLV